MTSQQRADYLLALWQLLRDRGFDVKSRIETVDRILLKMGNQ